MSDSNPQQMDNDAHIQASLSENEFHFQSLTPSKKIDAILKGGMYHAHETYHPSFKPLMVESQKARIINPNITLRMLDVASRKAESIAAEGGSALFIGTKQAVNEVVESQACRCNQYYLKHNIGGVASNIKYTVEEALKRLQLLEAKQESSAYTKKERSSFARQAAKAARRLAGVRNREPNVPQMSEVPRLFVIVDPHKEFTIVQEIRALRERSKHPITTIILSDGFENRFSLRDLSEHDILVPGNDDGRASVELFCIVIADAILAGSHKAAQQAARKAAEHTGSEAELARTVAATSEPTSRDTEQPNNQNSTV